MISSLCLIGNDNADFWNTYSIISSPSDIAYGHTFQIQTSLSGAALQGVTQMVLSNPGFHTQYVLSAMIAVTKLTAATVGRR